MALTPIKHSIPLSDGNSIPLIGLGTYSNPQNTPKGTALAAVKRAIEVGYRHIDGAMIYCNEDEVGQAIREKIADGTVKREDIFYCGKLWNTFHPPELVRPTLERTLKELQLDYVDLYIIEMPTAFRPGDTFYPQDENGKSAYHKTDLCATWEAMEACKDAGLAKSIGVSNFNKRQLELILNKPGLKHKPVTNQSPSSPCESHLHTAFLFLLLCDPPSTHQPASSTVNITSEDVRRHPVRLHPGKLVTSSSVESSSISSI